MLEINFEAPIEFSAIVTTTVSLFATFILARYTLFAKRDYQRKEALNRVLFGLLECRWAAQRAIQFQALDIPRFLTERIELKIPGFQKAIEENHSSEWEVLLSGLGTKIADGVINSDYKILYSTAIEELSKVEPMLAYEISSRANWDKTFELMESHLETVMETTSLASDNQQIVSDALEKKLGDTKVEMLDTLSKDILRVLRLCSITSWAKTKILGLWQPALSLEEDLILSIDKTIDEDILPFMSSLLQMITENQDQSPITTAEEA